MNGKGGLLMKINLTKKQYRLLIDLIYAGNWIVNSTKNAKELNKEYEDLVQYIYSFYKDYDLENVVEYDEKYERYFETRDYEESEISDFIEEYDDYTFWQKLESMLAKRDAVKEFDGKVTENNYEEILKRTFELEEKYENEFVENGLENINVNFK